MNIIQITKFVSIILCLIVSIPLFIETNINPIISIILIIGIYLSYVFFCAYIKRKLTPIKSDKTLEEVLNILGNFQKVDISINEEIKEIKSLKLFDGNFNICNFDDCINGMYKNLNISIRELSLEKDIKVGRRTKRFPVFHGILIKIPCAKKFKGYTLINGINDTIEKIELEDINFSLNFNVRGTDQIESRYLLTTSFINRMMELKENNIVQCFSLSFENGNTYIAVHTIEDSFQQGDCEETLCTIFSIIDTLKLDQNIGM